MKFDLLSLLLCGLNLVYIVGLFDMTWREFVVSIWKLQYLWIVFTRLHFMNRKPRSCWNWYGRVVVMVRVIFVIGQVLVLVGVLVAWSRMWWMVSSLNKQWMLNQLIRVWWGDINWFTHLLKTSSSPGSGSTGQFGFQNNDPFREKWERINKWH